MGRRASRGGKAAKGRRANREKRRPEMRHDGGNCGGEEEGGKIGEAEKRSRFGTPLGLGSWEVSSMK